MKLDIKPIQTDYSGCRFRSRLEARWAVFFDNLGIPWEYEPQGFELPSGRYLPDFWLPTIRGGLWFEAKGQSPTEAEHDLAWELATASNADVIIAFGGIPWPDNPSEPGRIDRMSMIIRPSIDGCRCWDLPYQWCVGPVTGRIGIEWGGIGTHISDEDSKAPHGHTADAPQIVEAYRAARSARFEFGETPKPCGNHGPHDPPPSVSVPTGRSESAPHDEPTTQENQIHA